MAGFGEGPTPVPFWKDVYGFSMEAVSSKLQGDLAAKAIAHQMFPEDVVTTSQLIQVSSSHHLRPLHSSRSD